MSAPSCPRHAARPQRFSLGAPRNVAVAPDGSRVVFLRSAGGTDRVTMLWVLDLPSGGEPAERVVADPRALVAGEDQLSAEEQARRERAREGAGGVVTYATDTALTLAAFTLSGEAYVADLVGDGGVRALGVPGPVIDPRPDPTGVHVAYVSGGAVRVVRADGAGDRQLAGQDLGPDITWGLAEFIAAEEMGRLRGFWWAPDGSALIGARADSTGVHRWYTAARATPGREPAEVAYPAAGTPNAEVSAHVLGLDGSRVDIGWDAAAFPYLAAGHWSGEGPPLLEVQSRDQR